MSTEPTTADEPINNSFAQERQNERRDGPPRTGRNPPSQPSGIFSVPAPIKHLFDQFPLRTYPANELPQRAPRFRDENVLYVFTTEEGARTGAPSFNPACLKWQTYLRFNDIPFRTVASNNHASPSGALPFLLPAISNSTPTNTAKPITPPPVPSSKLQRWCANNAASTIEEPGDMRYDAYLSLLDHKIRRAWLHTIYLSPNTPTTAEPLYILPTSRNPLIRLSTARTLRLAALAELTKSSPSSSAASPVINVEALYRDADAAFEALETLLGDDEWFFGAERPGLFDASVFAYTHLLYMDEGFGGGWVDGRLRECVLGRKGLRRHRERVVKKFY